jgi:hypothetical protein
MEQWLKDELDKINEYLNTASADEIKADFEDFCKTNQKSKEQENCDLLLPKQTNFDSSY